MTPDDVVFVAIEAMRSIVTISFPLLLTALIVGLVVVVFQALTQIQDGTLQFIPKILIMFAVLLAVLPFMAQEIDLLAGRVFQRIIQTGLN